MSNQPAGRMRIDSRRGWLPSGRELWAYRQLVAILGRRDITVRYRQTALGTLWVFAGPLVSAGLFSFVFGRVASLPTAGVPYFVFSYAGLLAWNIFSNTLSGAAGSVTGSAGIITKVYFPRIVVVLATFASTLVNSVISFALLLVMLVIADVAITAQMVLLPVWLILGVVLAMGLGLTFTALSVWYRDVNYLTPLITQVLLFLSPVAYSIEAVPANLRNLYLLNPLAVIVEGTRWSTLGGDYCPPAWSILLASLVTITAGLVGLMVFARFEWKFADVV